MNETKNGTLYGVGVGPGDPELLTLKAARMIEQAKVLAYPSPEGGESFARSIVARHIPDECEEIVMSVPMRTERFAAQSVYDESAERIEALLASGQDVVVLCEGDPFFYGSFMYLHNRLSNRFNVEIVSGVSSLVACAGRLAQPLAGRNDVLTILPGPMDDAALQERLSLGGSFAIIKVGRHLPRIRSLLERNGLLANAGYVERASLPSEKIMPLAEVDESCVPYFSMILVYEGGEAWKK
ncbi:precorrin-2/cobalt-factor-2 C20-methyltransferase [Cohaesibacter sp. ES.047]|uniref:precorrin-2 C(20)-methyltransferase n=1 Tax=Cohaesibacter sp. ES.047 TaxID=1798205 RepID=UPI000BB9A327|nr:precorrin-2 C(20)-methyltransferase [Cohaesibacter sp. ES.047]SNY93555.1 precorrin-2/cobalt-factor-2 C20-methyltransferase [Cohaesibacter sp. ES.047]